MRAGSVRPRGLAVITKSMHLNLPAKPAAGRLSMLPDGADGRFAAYKTKKKGQKKAKKRGWRAKSPGLAARQGIGGREVVAASASLGAGLGVHFLPAAFRGRWGKPGGILVCTLFAGRIVLRCPASVCTFCRIASG